MNTRDQCGFTARHLMLYAFAICFSNVCLSGEVRAVNVHLEEASADGQARPPKSSNTLSGKSDERPKAQPNGNGLQKLQSTSGNEDKKDDSPSYLLMPSNRLAQEPSIRNGCWARIYGDRDFEGGALTLTGPLSMPTMLGPFGINWKNRVRSIKVGKTAVLTVFDNVDFKQKIATIEPGKRIADLSKKMGYFDDFSSMKISCKT